MHGRWIKIWLPPYLLALATLAGAEEIKAAPAQPAPAATPAPLDELTRFCQQADYIVQGQVIARATSCDVNGHIWTTYTVEVSDSLKSPATPASQPGTPRQIEIRQPGGQFGDRRQLVTDTAHFRQNEEVILFTKDYGQGWQSVTEGERGCLRVRTLQSTAHAASPTISQTRATSQTLTGQAHATATPRLQRLCPDARQLAPGLPIADLDGLKQQLRAAIGCGRKDGRS